VDVPTIVMPPGEARAKYDEYRAGLEGREPTPEDKGILLGYRALANGRAVLNLTADLTPLERAVLAGRLAERPQ
jgi:hypothetical protein